MKKILILIVLFGATSSLLAQEQSNLLDEYRTMALEYNHDLKSAEKSISASVDLIKKAKADMKPTVSGGANFNYIGNPTQLSLGAMNFQAGNMQYGAALYLQQPIYTGGRVLETIRIAKLQGSLSVNEAEMIRSAVCYQTDIQYWNTAARGELVTIAQEFYNSMSSLVGTIKERVDVGLVDKQDLLMVEVKQNEAELRLLQAKNSYTTGLMALNSIIGVDLNNQTKVDKNIPNVLVQGDLLTKEIIDRPEISMAKGQVEIAESSLKLNDSRYLPQLYAGVDGGYSSPGYDFMPDIDFNYAVHVKLSVPIFEWGKRRSDKRISSERIGMATDNLNKTIDNINLEVQSTKVALTQTLESVRLSESSLAKALENEKRAIERYDEGESSILEVIDAQIYRQTSQINYVQSKVAAQSYYSELLRVLNEYSY